MVLSLARSWYAKARLWAGAELASDKGGEKRNETEKTALQALEIALFFLLDTQPGDSSYDTSRTLPSYSASD
jgi:hypothetical protein